MIIGNWKMNMDQSLAKVFAEKIGLFIQENNIDNDKIVIAPSYPFFNLLFGHGFLLSGQDCSQYRKGSYTGDVSAHQLKDMGCRYVLVGHSERRAFSHETSIIVNKKAKRAVEAGLIPVICVGETKEEKERGRTEEVIIRQMLDSIPEEITKFAIAYEPVWAIGSGLVPEVSDINIVANLIRNQLNKLNLFENNNEILYGGSVNPDNCYEVMQAKEITGLLVGGASLDHNSFIEIIKKIYRK